MGKARKHSASKGGKSKQQSIIEHALPLLKKQMEMVGKQVNIPCSLECGGVSHYSPHHSLCRDVL